MKLFVIMISYLKSEKKLKFDSKLYLLKLPCLHAKYEESDFTELNQIKDYFTENYLND